MGVHGLLQLAVYVVAGLDHRYAWSAAFPAAVQAAALVLCSLGYALVVWATASNAFFSLIVRIQTERGHRSSPAAPIGMSAIRLTQVPCSPSHRCRYYLARGGPC
jgi:hypothetical protein